MTFGEKVSMYINERISLIEKKYTKEYQRTENDLAEYDTFVFVNKLLADNPNIDYQDYFLFLSNAINNSIRSKAVTKEYNEKIYWYVSQKLLEEILNDTRKFIE